MGDRVIKNPRQTVDQLMTLAAAHAHQKPETKETEESGAWFRDDRVGTGRETGGNFGSVHGVIVDAEFVEGAV